MLIALELTAFEGRIARRVLDPGGATSLPRLPITVGVPVTLLALGSWAGRGNEVRVQTFVVLRQ